MNVEISEKDKQLKIRLDRTSELRNKGFEGRRLGPVQMTTDTAVRVTRTVIQDKGDPLNLEHAESLMLTVFGMQCSPTGRDTLCRPSRAEN